MRLISRALAVAMVNADYSGLTERDLELICHFPCFTVTDWRSASTDINGKCSITGLWDHCVEVEVQSE